MKKGLLFFIPLFFLAVTALIAYPAFADTIMTLTSSGPGYNATNPSGSPTMGNDTWSGTLKYDYTKNIVTGVSITTSDSLAFSLLSSSGLDPFSLTMGDGLGDSGTFSMDITVITDPLTGQFEEENGTPSGSLEVDTSTGSLFWEMILPAPWDGNLGGGSSPVPEPSTLLLFSPVLLGIGCFCLRKRFGRTC